MKVKEWAYQFRESQYPWCVCAVITYPRGYPQKRTIAFDIYSELIHNDVHCKRIKAQCYDQSESIVNLLTSKLKALDPEFDFKDLRQLERFAATILAKE